MGTLYTLFSICMHGVGFGYSIRTSVPDIIESDMPVPQESIETI